MLGSLLINIYANDFPKVIQSNIAIFADDTKLHIVLPRRITISYILILISLLNGVKSGKWIFTTVNTNICALVLIIDLGNT